MERVTLRSSLKVVVGEWSGANVDGKKKSNEEAKKKQRKGFDGKSDTL
jgi:hypothetical protein